VSGSVAIAGGTVISYGHNTTGTFQAGSTTTVVKLAATASGTANYYTFYGIRITANGSGTGTPVGEVSIIDAYVGTTKNATIFPAFSVAPDNQNTYIIEEIIMVAVISGTFTPGGEDIQNQDSDSATLTVATTFTPDGTIYPSNSVIVTGDNTASEDIFRDVRNAYPAIATDPDTNCHCLKLDCTLDIGRRDEASTATKTLSLNENTQINFGYYIEGSSSYKTEFTMGAANYKSDNESNFPPYSAFRGCRLATGTNCGDAFKDSYFYENSIVKIYNSILTEEDEGFTTAVYFQCETIFSDVLALGFYLINLNYSDIKLNKFVVTGLQGSVPTAGGMEWVNCTINNRAGFGFFALGYFETDIKLNKFVVTGLQGSVPTAGGMEWVNCTINNRAGFGFFALGYFETDIKLNKFVVTGLQGSVPTAGGMEWVNCTINNRAGFGFFALGYFETDITDTSFVENQAFVGAIVSDFMLNTIDCDCPNWSALPFGTIKWADKKTLNLNVTDSISHLNKLENCVVQVLDKNGKSALYEDTGETLEENLDKTETGIDVSDGTQFAAGDVIRIDIETMTVSSIASDTLTVVRGQEGTTANHITNGIINRRIFKQTKSVKTDSNGDIVEQAISRHNRVIGGGATAVNYYHLPFTLIIQKSGYETYKAPLYLGTWTGQSYKTDAAKLQIKLRNSLSPGRDSMADTFK